MSGCTYWGRGSSGHAACMEEPVQVVAGLAYCDEHARLKIASMRLADARRAEQVGEQKRISKDADLIQSALGISTRPFTHEYAYDGEVIVSVKDLMRLVEMPGA